MNKPRIAIPVLILVGLVTSIHAVIAQQESDDTNAALAKRVAVTNFPETWKVKGEVSIKGPSPQAAMTMVQDILVAPVAPTETTRLTNGGVIDMDGFTGMVLHLAGQLRSQNAKPGAVGAILIPDVEVARRALDESGLLLFPIEIKASTGTGTPAYFTSEGLRAPVAFPRYRVLLYNTSDKSATVTLYAYLTN